MNEEYETKRRRDIRFLWFKRNLKERFEENMIKELIEYIGPRLAAALLQAISTLDRVIFSKHLVLISVLVCLLIVGGITGYYYYARTRQFQEIISSTVNMVGEGSSQQYKGLEALVISTVNPKILDSIQKAKLSEKFVTHHLKAIHEALSHSIPKDASPTGITLSIPTFETARQSQKLPQNAIITDNAPEGYLFFPFSRLRTPIEHTQFLTIYTESQGHRPSQTLANAVASDPLIADDIAISGLIVSEMKACLDTELVDPDATLKELHVNLRPVQVYYITKNGLNRIVNGTKADEHAVVYGNMYQATTFFPNRPYYEGAFRGPHSRGSLAIASGPTQDAFYVSKPYWDSSGFGVVITLARYLTDQSYQDQRHSEGVIAFDLRIPIENENPTIFEILKQLTSFGAPPTKVTCDIGTAGSSTVCKRQSSPEKQLAEFMTDGTLSDVAKQLAGAMTDGTLSDVVGNISILSTTNALTFAIPSNLPTAPAPAHTLKTDFWVASLNLKRFQHRTTLLGLISVVSLGLTLVVAFVAWYREQHKSQSLGKESQRLERDLQVVHEAFKAVDEVLYGAPMPYCRLNAQDMIVDCNTAFCGFLKWPTDQQSVNALKNQTLESLLAQPSRAKYHAVQELRMAGKPVPPYNLFFVCKDGTEAVGEMKSGVIPSRTRLPDSTSATSQQLPETFGILTPLESGHIC
jgi:hypothetical protein